ncbi:MAG: FAD-binding oxidoreductase [Cytophagales bacterium]|nr:MAG: FAD-binding oxidoreductase [Cytophagales bacterium]
MKSDFETIVIGKGLVGSSAAKYLCQNGEKVAVIGADEPAQNTSALVYASHYDQARVQRIIGKDETWTKLNADSVQAYEKIQRESKIDFHKGVGCLYINPYGQDNYLRNLPSLAQKFTTQYSLFDSKTDNHKYFDGLTFPENSVGIFEPSPSGFINPRLLIKAQLEIFRKHRGVEITDTVIDLAVIGDKKFVLTTESGNTYTASKILVATGSFLNCFGILAQKVQLQTKSEVVLLVKVEADMVAHYSNLPSLLYEIDENGTEGIYMIQPVLYPDGNFYLKIGCNSPDDIFFESLEQIQNWFEAGESGKYGNALMGAVSKILPSLNLANVLTKKCVISRTPHGNPYIGETSVAGVFLAGGCNGYSAMCSDAIGKVAASLLLDGVFPEGYSKDAFEIKYESK